MSNYNELRKERLLSSLGLEDGRNPIPVVDNGGSHTSTIASISVFILVVLFHLLFIPVRISGASMQPTLTDNQWILVRRNEKVERFDVVVLKERLEDGGDDKVVVKRVIGLPGDRVVVVDGQLYINNELYEESYTSEEKTQYFDQVDFVIEVPEGHVFVMGDNRDVSRDSRALGSFKMDAIMGVKMGR